jgi:maltose alpha-D-glucosyltransferase/alpha-amylase
MEFLNGYLGHYQKIHNMGHMALPTGNHDINPRISKGRSTSDLELVFLFILTMPGVPFIWYGDEIGMHSFDHLPSKEGGYNRTGARTPMQWSDSPNAGFSSASPEMLYLPIDPASDRPTVLQQENDPDSLLQRVKKLVALRKAHSALQASAAFKILFAQPGIYPMVFLREDDQESFIVLVNPSSQIVDAQIPSLSASFPQTVYGADGVFSKINNRWNIHLQGVSGGIYRIMKS